MSWFSAALIFVITIIGTKAELTPPYFNLAEGRKISATATCGVDTDGPELYCKLVGANTENDNQHTSHTVIQGQVGEIKIILSTFLFNFISFKKPKIS